MKEITSIDKNTFLKVSVIVGLLLSGERLLAEEYFKKLHKLKFETTNEDLKNLIHDLFLFFNNEIESVDIDDVRNSYRVCCIDFINTPSF